MADDLERRQQDKALRDAMKYKRDAIAIATGVRRLRDECDRQTYNRSNKPEAQRVYRDMLRALTVLLGDRETEV